jgi:hypothetical protein
MDDKDGIWFVNGSDSQGYPSFRSEGLTNPSGISILPGLYLTGLYRYPLFHHRNSLVDILTLLIALCTFTPAWKVKRFLVNTDLLFVGIAFLLVGSIDLNRTRAYKGAGMFRGYDTALPSRRR